MIRILHVLGKMNRGGAETMIMNLFREIDRTKIIFDFVVHTDEVCAYDKEILELGGKIYHVPRYKGINDYQYRKVWKNFFIKHPEYRIVHGHIGSTAAIYLSIAQKYGCYTIAHSHNTTSHKKTLKDIIYCMLSYPTRYIADYFFACSLQAGLDRYGKKIVEKSGCFSVFNNAIDTGLYAYDLEKRVKKRTELGISDKFVVGVVGRITRQKNPFFVINVFKEVLQKCDNAVLLWVGDGDLRNELEQMIQSARIEEYVQLLGVRDDVAELYQAMDVFFLPSLYEGLGMVAIEAQCSGLSCVVSEQFQDEVMITEHIQRVSLLEDVKIWADKICYTQQYIRMNNNNIIAKSGFDIKTTTKILMEFYQNNVR